MKFFESKERGFLFLLFSFLEGKPLQENSFAIKTPRFQREPSKPGSFFIPFLFFSYFLCSGGWGDGKSLGSSSGRFFIQHKGPDTLLKIFADLGHLFAPPGPHAPLPPPLLPSVPGGSPPLRWSRLPFWAMSCTAAAISSLEAACSSPTAREILGRARNLFQGLHDEGDLFRDVPDVFIQRSGYPPCYAPLPVERERRSEAMDPARSAMFPAAELDSSASLRTSSATTAKPSPRFSRPGGFDGGIQSEEVGLICDARDGGDDFLNLGRPFLRALPWLWADSSTRRIWSFISFHGLPHRCHAPPPPA